MKISLCLLVWNELEGCKIDVPRLPVGQFHEVYAVDGGSTDGTVEYLESKGIPVYQQPKKGLNAAYIHSVEKSTGDAVVVFFPKGTICPSTLLDFEPHFKAGYELVVASRNIEGGRNEEDSALFKPRKWGVLGLATFAALIWRREGHAIKDVLHGYKGFSVSGFKRMNPVDHGLSIDIEMVIRSYRLRIKRCEFPVHEVARPFGESNFKILPTAKRLLKYLWWEMRRRDS
ncbi:glycosyltransferase [Geomonas terrae]|uniref:Glycosyltransferase n=1 Tax=Geomonas terrae TaxID=2562681 RepID=A0A4S1CAA0_9BACT|nr:glycosyltransferase [Geomonas terrae]TGU70209.1 glycosyltransferase [Geomonas terrae]